MQYLATAGYLSTTSPFVPYCSAAASSATSTPNGTLQDLGRSMRGGLLDYENLQRNFQLSTTRLYVQ